METLFQQILNLLIQPPGNLIYHLVLAFSVISSLQAAWIGKQTSAYQHTGRLILGLGMLLLGQVVLFLSSGLAWQGVLDSHLFLPILDRAVILFSLVWIVWLWNFPTPARLGDLVTGFLNLGVVILFALTFASWAVEGGRIPFNGSWMDWTWIYAGLFVVLTGMAVLLLTRPSGWGYGLGILGVSLAGLVAHLTLPSAGGDFSGYIRLSQLAAFPLLTTLLNRFAVAQPPKEQPPVTATEVPFPRERERRHYSADPRTLNALLELSNNPAPDKILGGLSKALAHTMISDLCFIVLSPENGRLSLESGYDLVREEALDRTLLDQSQVPNLANAFQRARPLRILPSDAQPMDVSTLGSVLGLKDAGSLLFIPLDLEDKSQGGILFLSPYANRQWSIGDQDYLASTLPLIARLVTRSRQPVKPVQPAIQATEALRAELESLKQDNRSLLDEITSLRQVGAKTASAPGTDISSLVALQEETQRQISALQAENERLHSALNSEGISVLSPDQFGRMENELRSTLQELAQLQNQLAGANARNLLLEREFKQANHGSSEDHEVITSIIQEIRQPMSSIIGYTDLLLAETVGILGALQKQFLERIKASTERMRSLMEDLIRISAMQEGPIELLPEPVELGAVIDSAMEESSAQLREKNIALKVDLPEEMPMLKADRDAVQQIILHLLQNAGAATPPEGTVTLHARMQEDNGDNFLLVQITDTGGGIQPHDLSRVFSRRYRADLPLIQGLGDTGVGLSIAKTLAEAHGGRMWVDSVIGQGTTFSVLLPVLPNQDQSPAK